MGVLLFATARLDHCAVRDLCRYHYTKASTHRIDIPQTYCTIPCHISVVSRYKGSIKAITPRYIRQNYTKKLSYFHVHSHVKR